jgi:hypothetical protein
VANVTGRQDAFGSWKGDGLLAEALYKKEFFSDQYADIQNGKTVVSAVASFTSSMTPSGPYIDRREHGNACQLGRADLDQRLFSQLAEDAEGYEILPKEGFGNIQPADEVIFKRGSGQVYLTLTPKPFPGGFFEYATDQVVNNVSAFKDNTVSAKTDQSFPELKNTPVGFTNPFRLIARPSDKLSVKEVYRYSGAPTPYSYFNVFIVWVNDGKEYFVNCFGPDNGSYQFNAEIAQLLPTYGFEGATAIFYTTGRFAPTPTGFRGDTIVTSFLERNEFVVDFESAQAKTQSVDSVAASPLSIGKDGRRYWRGRPIAR